ncbi:MAG: antibiotic biosynthesis monooxygenase [Candidatus Dadabacteria bacterium]|nr:MAG: antibiotic biosynthesis monooxygenase [Candidatus Dadabacteria bacterium]
MFVVVAKIKAKAGKGDELAQVFTRMVDWVTENEADTLTYICSRSSKDPDEFLFFERYVNEKAFQEHTSSPQFLELASAMQGMVEGPVEMSTYHEIAGKL